MTELDNYYNELISISINGVMLVSLLPLIYGLIQWKKFRKPLKIFYFYLLVSLLFRVLEQVFFWAVGAYKSFWWPILDAYHIEDTNFMRYFWQVNNFSLLGWFLYRILLPESVAQWAKNASVFLLLLITVNYFFIQGYNMAGGLNSTVSDLYCAILPLISMWYLYNRDSQVPLVHNPYFWINLGLIIPCLLGLFVYTVGDVIYKENFGQYAQLTILKNITEIGGQMLTVIGYYYARNAKYLEPVSTNEKFSSK